MTARPMRWSSTENGMDGLVLEAFTPQEPGPGELSVEVGAAALNFSDLLMIDGTYQVKPPRPFTPGQEVAGVVRAAGPGARFKPGDRVAGKVEWGGFASHAIMRDAMAIAIPGDVGLADSAALPVVYTTAYVALTECTAVSADETVLVHAAAGGVGLAAVQIAAARGAHVIAAAGSETKRALALEHGASAAIDPGDPEWFRHCKAMTDGRGIDVVVDPVGGDVTLGSLRVLANGGRLLIVGFASGSIPQIPANRLLLKRASAIGVYWNHDTDGEMLARVTARMMDDLSAGRIRPVVDRRSGLEALPQALGDLAARRTNGKVVLTLNDQPEA